MVEPSRSVETGASGLTKSPEFIPQSGTTTPALNPGTLRFGSSDLWGPVLGASSDVDYPLLQPVIDSLPAELTAHESEGAVQFICGYRGVFWKS